MEKSTSGGIQKHISASWRRITETEEKMIEMIESE